jgi:hypothetical protein
LSSSWSTSHESAASGGDAAVALVALLALACDFGLTFELGNLPLDELPFVVLVDFAATRSDFFTPTATSHPSP